MLPKTMYLEVEASFCVTMAASLETGTDSLSPEPSSLTNTTSI